MKIAVMSWNDGLKPGAGKHAREVLTEVEQFTEQMLAAGTVESVMSLSTLLGSGGAMIWIVDQSKLTEFLSGPEFAALRPRIALSLENWRMALYAVQDEQPPAEQRERYFEMAAQY
jgi:hypothetical protein